MIHLPPRNYLLTASSLFSLIDLEFMALFSSLLVPQLPSLRLCPPPIVSQEKTSLAPVHDPVTVTSCSLALSENTLRPTPKFPLSNNPGVQETRIFSSSSIRSPKSSTLLTTLRYPSILARFIAFLDWSDLYHLLCTCQCIRDLFRNTGIRDVILSRYVVGYGYCLRNRDPNYFRDVQISIHDLDLLCTSTK